MSDAPLELRELQAWMQQALLQPDSSVNVAENITASARQSSAERLAIYQRAYLARLLGVMRDMFPALTATLGEATFDALAQAYLQAHPSSSYTLNRLGEQFADYLHAMRPPREADALDWADFVIELARLEHAIEDVFDGPGPEQEKPIDAASLAALSAAEAESLQVRIAPGLRLLAFAFPLNDFYSAFRSGATADIPAPKPTWLALYRRDYVVRRLPLTQPSFDVLQALASGETLAAALAKSGSAAAADVQTWFQAWTAAGLLLA
jgi:hypothetical protein